MADRPQADDRRSLERLALADWSEAAAALVVSVTVVGGRAEVALLVNGDYEYWTYFQRDEHGWYETASSSGPCDGWEDPSAIQWGS